MITLLINVLIIIVVGAICFYVIDKFVRDGRLANLLRSVSWQSSSGCCRRWAWGSDAICRKAAGTDPGCDLAHTSVPGRGAGVMQITPDFTEPG